MVSGSACGEEEGGGDERRGESRTSSVSIDLGKLVSNIDESRTHW